MTQEENRMKYCERCGALLKENGICPACGFLQQPTKQKKDRTALLVVITIAVILLLCVVLFFTCIHLFNRLWGEGKQKTVLMEERKVTEGLLDDADGEKLPEESTLPEESRVPQDDFQTPSGEGDGEWETEDSYIGNGLYEGTYDSTGENWKEEGQREDVPYYSGPYNDLKDNLSYQISFLTTYCNTEDGHVFIQVEYPQITSGRKDEEYLNGELYYEYEYFRDFYMDYVADTMSEDGIFYFSSDAYVTYMDEEILSVVYSEKIRYQDGSDYLSDINFYCVNIDLATGNILTNTDILNLNDDFAVDFREREISENGDGALTDYTDQEILAMLKDEGTLVLFYTPMGLEVGLNLDGEIVYVTYEDYMDYRNIF